MQSLLAWVWASAIFRRVFRHQIESERDHAVVEFKRMTLKAINEQRVARAMVDDAIRKGNGGVKKGSYVMHDRRPR